MNNNKDISKDNFYFEKSLKFLQKILIYCKIYLIPVSGSGINR